MTRHKKEPARHQETLKSHAKALVQATGHLSDAGVSEARNKLSQVLDSMSETVEEAQEAAMEKAKQADEFIKENPYIAVGAAIGVGVLIGCLVSRRGN